MKSKIVINEIQSKCRICLCENVDIIDIYSIDENCGKISSAVMECSSVHIEPDDELPTIICKICLVKLREAYKFRQLCRLSDQTLRQYINYILNQTTTEVLINNILITNNINNYHTAPSNVAQLICETTPVILKPTNTNILINTAQNDGSTTQQLQNNGSTMQQLQNGCSVVQQLQNAGCTTQKLQNGGSTIQQVQNGGSTMQQLQNGGIPTILTQTINDNCDLMKMPIMIKVEKTKTNNEFTSSSMQQVNKVESVSLSPLTLEQVEQANLVDQILSLEENSSRTTKFECKYCNKIYETNQQLRRHEKTTHGERKFICNICEQKFTEKSVLKSHMMAKHTRERPFKCQYCIKSYVSGSHLRTHMRVHTGELPYKCETCEKCFASVNVYKKHIKTHSSLRPHHCTKCPLTFTRLELLRCHVTRVHDEDDDGDTASDTFKKDATDFEECKICKKKFQRKELLKRHSRTHANDKKHKCIECLKSFT